MLPTPGKRRGCLAYSSMLSTREKRRGHLVLFVEHNKNDATPVPLVRLHSLNPHLTAKCELQDDSLTPLSKNKNAKKDHTRKMNNAGFPKLPHCIRGYFPFLNIQYDFLQLVHAAFLLQFSAHLDSQEKFLAKFYDTTNSTLK
jgi:hypothetical protein